LIFEKQELSTAKNSVFFLTVYASFSGKPKTEALAGGLFKLTELEQLTELIFIKSSVRVPFREPRLSEFYSNFWAPSA
jgi:hypothetical protein